MYKYLSFTLFLASFSGSSAAITPSIQDKVYGCIMGAALGDMLGAPVEFIKTKAAITKKYPPYGIQGIHSLKPSDFATLADGSTYIPYTDDTAMTILVIESLLGAFAHSWSSDECMRDIALAFVEDMNSPYGWAMDERAPGLACLKNVKIIEKRILNNELENLEWWIAGTEKEGGCGSVMRAHPFGLFFYKNPQMAEEWAVYQSKITHAAPLAQAACAAFAAGISYACQGYHPYRIAHKMVTIADKYDTKTAQMIQKAIAYSKDQSVSSDDVFKEFQGWAAHEAIAAATYIFLKHPESLSKAIILGVNTPGDSDSIASMAGALVGAYSGMDKECSTWAESIEESEYLKTLCSKSTKAIQEDHQKEGLADCFIKLIKLPTTLLP